MRGSTIQRSTVHGSKHRPQPFSIPVATGFAVDRHGWRCPDGVPAGQPHRVQPPLQPGFVGDDRGWHWRGRSGGGDVPVPRWHSTAQPKATIAAVGLMRPRAWIIFSTSF
jgi:hypothetical protein